MKKLPDQGYAGQWFDNIEPIHIDPSQPNLNSCFESSEQRTVACNLIHFFQHARGWRNFSWENYSRYCQEHGLNWDESQKEVLLEMEIKGYIRSAIDRKGWLGVTDAFLHALEGCISDTRIRQLAA